ncbi:unnamed protein product [Chrysodeixis includens]|uniref:Uncharacterized protein n=1 Tax=Chrysodeixis includens TaxID=689277 RepID=A0A9P0BWW8_CHRIL|nr:unnamed protein product [Chrysodeixis includens]
MVLTKYLLSPIISLAGSNRNTAVQQYCLAADIGERVATPSKAEVLQKRLDYKKDRIINDTPSAMLALTERVSLAQATVVSSDSLAALAYRPTEKKSKLHTSFLTDPQLGSSTCSS